MPEKKHSYFDEVNRLRDGRGKPQIEMSLLAMAFCPSAFFADAPDADKEACTPDADRCRACWEREYKGETPR